MIHVVASYLFWLINLPSNYTYIGHCPTTKMVHQEDRSIEPISGHGYGHVVLVPYPSQGHINPLLQFAKRLVSKGLKATLATTYYTSSSIHSNVSVEPISDGFDQAGYAQAPNEQTYLQAFKEAGSRSLSEIITKYKNSDSPATCVVYDSFLIWALEVARKHGVYGAAFFTNSVTVCSIFCRVHHGLLTLPVSTEDLPVVMPGVPPLDRFDLPTFIRTPQSYPAYLTMKLNQYSNLAQADWIFCNSFQELESQEAKGIVEIWPAKLIGPMIPSSYLDGRIEGDKAYGASLWKPLSEECLTWLDKKPCGSVVYVSFGSMVSLSAKQMEEVALGLKNCGWNFIWVVKESEQAKFPNGFVDSLQQEEEKSGLVVSWCNQLQVLAHEAVGCFVTHCGWNSTLEALGLGVPMVGMAKWTDQTTNAKFIEDVWEVGVRANDDGNGVVGREELKRSIREVMEGERSEKMKRNARKWRNLSREAISEGGSSDKNINEFVEALMRDGGKGKGKETDLNDF